MAKKLNSSHGCCTSVLTIDGPAGSGKGAISQRVAEKLGWNILDSGALYRLVALSAQHEKLDFSNINEIDVPLEKLAKKLDVVFIPSDDSVKIMLEGCDVTHDIRTEECGHLASQVATRKGVRAALLARQRKFSEGGGLVADGRDMGTVVFPDATLKVFLTATAEIRAERRFLQLKERGINANLAGLVRDIEERDARDMNRKEAPLVPAVDAITVDTSDLTIDEVVQSVMNELQKVVS